LNFTKNSYFSIGDKKVGNNQPCYVIAEIGINHNGDISMAKKLIDAAVDAKADAVKFQKRSLQDVYKKDIMDEPNLESQGFEILIDVLKKVEFGEKEYIEIKKYCDEKNITFLCTAWDIPSVDFLEKLNVPAYKIASADMTNLPLIKYIIKTKKLILISTGMSTMHEIENTVEFLKNENAKFILLHTNSTYPTPVEKLNLKLITTLREKFDVPIGYSGHEQGIIPTLAARVLGIVIVERHITLDKTMEGLDQSVSLTPDEFSLLIKYIRESEKAIGTTEKKMTRGEVLQREILGKSIVASSHIEIGEIISENNIEIKGPAKGLSPQHYYKILGKKVVKKIKKYEYINLENLE
jgi:sialic acid synthase SpsE